MTDEEYRECLFALARRYLRGKRPGPLLEDEVGRLIEVAKLAHAVEGLANNSRLMQAFAGELRNGEGPIKGIAQLLDNHGVLAALDEMPEVIFGELRRSVVPEEDVTLLRQTGVTDPEAEITTVIQYARHRMAKPELQCRETILNSYVEIDKAARLLIKNSHSASKRDDVSRQPRRKIFNGVGKILSGLVTGAGNLLLFTGTILAPDPATGIATIASSAIAVASVFQGIGDLRGE